MIYIYFTPAAGGGEIVFLLLRGFFLKNIDFLSKIWYAICGGLSDVRVNIGAGYQNLIKLENGEQTRFPPNT